jgi:Protein of unknown function (DUF998)
MSTDSRTGARPKSGDRNGAMRSRTPVLLWAGTVAAIIYTTTVVVGGLVTPGYDHVADPVSSLYQAGAANGLSIALAFATYNIAIVLFGVGLARVVAATGGPRRRIGLLGAGAMVMTGVAGAFDDLFPQDPIGVALTTPGTMHVIFAAIASILTMITIGCFAAWLLARASMRRLGWYSVASLGAIFVFGGVTAASVATASTVTGLVERIPIFGFVIWVLVISLAFSYHPIQVDTRSVAADGATS